MALSALSKMRRVHSLLAFALCGVVLFALFLSSSSEAGPYTTTFAFGSRSSESGPACPDPLAPFDRKENVYRPVCRSLDAHAELNGALTVQLCLSSRTVNHGWLQIERTDAAACAASEAIVPSLDPESNVLLRAKGPDFFHIDFDGEQRWGAEVEVQYLGRCVYRYPFRLASGAPFNLSIWWTYQDYRAALETEDLATQYDLARPVLADAYQMIYPLSPASNLRRNGMAAGNGMCPPSVAMASDPAWRSPAQAAYLASLPECSEWGATASGNRVFSPERTGVSIAVRALGPMPPVYSVIHRPRADWYASKQWLIAPQPAKISICDLAALVLPAHLGHFPLNFGNCRANSTELIS